MSLAFLFPGQGSQSVGMGAEVFARYPDLVEEADQTLGYSLSAICLEDIGGQLGNTEFTQPALYLVSFLEAKAKIEDGQTPAFAAGHSVGEFAALAVAGCMSFADGLKMVSRRGQIMAQVSGGGMAAVIGLGSDPIRATLSAIGSTEVDLANFNSPGQIVISGPAQQIEASLAPLKEAGARMVVPLKVSGAFHSRMMEEPARNYSRFLEGITFSEPAFPVYSNVEAKPYPGGNAIAALLTRQIHSPVRWTELITQMRSDGADEFVECGPGNVLTKLLKQIP